MATTTKSTHRPPVSLSLPKSVPALIVYAESIVEADDGEPILPRAYPSARRCHRSHRRRQDRRDGGGGTPKGAATARNDKRKVLVGVLQQIRCTSSRSPTPTG
jgi:hypothetical protein